MRIIASALLLFAGIGLSAADAAFFRNEGLRLAWYLAAYLPMGLPVMKEAWEEIVHGDVFNEFTLMTLATIGAFYIGEYPEGVAVMLFYSLGELFQERAVGRARHSIRALLDVRPETGTVIRNTQPMVVNPREVRPGEVIEVKTGERVPLDGTLLNETAAFNTSALTGESLPRTLHEGEDVLAGMIATDKAVRLSVIRPFEDSALSRILAMVQEASERKAPAELFIRKFARIYTPPGVRLRVRRLALPRAGVPRHLLPLRVGGQHPAELLRRHRGGIAAGHPLQRRQLLGCHHQDRHHRVRQDGHPDARHL